MAVDFARRVMPALDKLLFNSLPQGACVLDLCCGTGRVTQALVERGFRATGVDASEPMLRLARHNARFAKFVLADVRLAAFAPGHAAVVSTFNSLAHVHTTGLAEVFRNVLAALDSGGRFVFDLTMDEQYQRRWQGCFAFVDDGGACIVRPSYDPVLRLARNALTVFHAHHGTYLRHDFEILQQCHDETDVRQALSDAGFTAIELFDAERDLGMCGEAGRVFFVAVKP